MCGIAGVAGIDTAKWAARVAPAMLLSIAHRGPDGHGVWADRSSSCLLAHKRLAVIDPENGAQPLSNEDGTIWITFNGCIYNYPDLRRELSALGHVFRTRCDTETIVHAYEEWGADCVSRFNGMWAFAIWDSRRKTLFCSRDRIGIKPFYYHWDGARFVFASEIKAILASRAALTRHFQTCLSPDDFVSSIEKIIYHMDEPAAGPGVFPQYHVSKLASQNVKVVLGGQGGDEIFVGYARYLVAYLEECLRGAIQDTAHRARYVATLSTIVPSLPTLQNYVPMLSGFWAQGLFDEPARRYYRLMDRFSDTKDLLSADMSLDHEKTFSEFDSIFNSHGAAAKINRIMCFDLKTHLQSLLHVEDRTSMAHGLESRVPLLDHRLVELMASVPPVLKFKNGLLKHLFRKAVAPVVPPQILNRKDKMGFPVPLSRWAAGKLRPFFQDVLLSHTCRERGLYNSRGLEKLINADQPFSRALWGVFSLELWHRVFLDSSPANPIPAAPARALTATRPDKAPL